jgi:hypothetical protein
MFGVATYLVGTRNVDRLGDVVTKQGIILGWWQPPVSWTLVSPEKKRTLRFTIWGMSCFSMHLVANSKLTWCSVLLYHDNGHSCRRCWLTGRVLYEITQFRPSLEGPTPPDSRPFSWPVGARVLLPQVSFSGHLDTLPWKYVVHFHVNFAELISTSR